MSSNIQFFFTFEPQFNLTEQDASECIQFDVLEFHLLEGLNEPFKLQAELISTDPNIDFDKLLDQSACFTIWQTPPAGASLSGLAGKVGDALDSLGAIGNVAGALGGKLGEAGALASKYLPSLSGHLGNLLGDKLSLFGLSASAMANAKPVRRVHGIISDISLGKTGHRYTRYSVVLEPQLARTMLSSDWRIFQQKTVPEIIAEVFKEGRITDFVFNEQLEHLQREYCVEADELDYDFISRLLAEEGFVFTYAHAEQSHQLEITDAVQTLGSISTNRSGEKSDQQDEKGSLIVEPVIYNANPSGDKPYPALYSFTYKERVRTARQTQRDYTFRNPRYAQEHSRTGEDMPSQSTVYERYNYPGRYKSDSAGAPFTHTKINALRNDAKLAVAVGDDARLQPGYAFEMSGHPRTSLNQYWRPVRVEHFGKQYTAAQEDAADTQTGTSYSQTAELVPATADWKAPIPPKPILHGPQIAIVTGPANEEIYTDEWGRVKVQFPWDRYGKSDEFSSCWIRVTQGWGMGAGDGQMSIPRVGQEVLVDFLDADPDQPMVVGRANNALNPPPYELPKHKTRSTWRSQTHKGQGFNEIRFEDENQREEIYVHAQKDQNIHINHNESTFIGNDRDEHVEQNEKIYIGHDRQEQVVHDEAVEIGNDRKHHIVNNEFLHIDQNQNIKIGDSRIETIYNHRQDDIKANHWVKIGGSYEAKVEGLYQIEAGNQIVQKTQVYELGVQDKIVLKSAGGKITLDASGITLEGNINIKGPMNQVGSGSGDGISISGNPVDGVLQDCSEMNR